MRKLLTALVLLVVGAVAQAEPRILNKQVMCDDRDTVFKSIVEDFGETPQWTGQSSQYKTNIVLTVNLKTRSWTLIEYDSTMACVLAVGENSDSRWGIPVQFKAPNGSFAPQKVSAQKIINKYL